MMRSHCKFGGKGAMETMQVLIVQVAGLSQAKGDRQKDSLASVRD